VGLEKESCKAGNKVKAWMEYISEAGEFSQWRYPISKYQGVMRQADIIVQKVRMNKYS